MSTARLRALLVVVLALVLSAATVSVAAEASAKPAIKTVQVSKSKKITVVRGTQVRIALETASDGGYSWAVTKKPARWVAKIGKPRVASGDSSGGVVGAPSTTYYRIAGKHLGRTTIKLVERRSFDRKDVAKRVTLTIVVKRR